MARGPEVDRGRGMPRGGDSQFSVWQHFFFHINIKSTCKAKATLRIRYVHIAYTQRGTQIRNGTSRKSKQKAATAIKRVYRI